MINSFLSKYMMDQVLKYRVPSVKAKKCIDSLQGRKKCGKCIQICKENAISFNKDIEIDKDRCSNCNICVSICPSGCIAPNYELIEKQYNAFSQNENVSISCNKSSSNTTLKVQCLASLPWEALAYGAITGKVSLDLRLCSDCENADLYSEVISILNKLEMFLGEVDYKEKINFIKEDEVIKEVEYSRRDLLKLIGHQSKRFANFAVPTEIDGNKNARIYKSMLIKKIQDSEEKMDIRYGWQTVKVNKDCWACGVCEKVCPQSAIKIDRSKDGIAEFRHYYMKCTHCGICEAVCNKKAIELTINKNGLKDKFISYDVLSRTCSVCGDPIRDNGEDKCIVCMRKSR